MIRTLRVRSLAVIDELELALGPRLNVMTGETGAGKSVLLGAIALLCGRRVGSDAIRTGAEEASIEAILDGPALLERARRAGLAGDGEPELLVSRTLTRAGRGRVRVNGRLATLSLLAQTIGESIEVVGQGDHQRLLRPDVQSELLDRFGECGPARERVGALHAEWRSLAEEIAARRADAAGRARREDQLRFEIEQIDRLDPTKGELETLAVERSRLRHADRLAQLAADALAALASEQGAGDRTARAQSAVRTAAGLDSGLAPVEEALERAGVELGEATRALERYSADLEHDPGRLEALEERHSQLEHLQARYGASVEAILDHRDHAREELERIGGGEEALADLVRERDRVGAGLRDAADALGKARRDAAGALCEVVTGELRALDLPRATFDVRFEQRGGTEIDGCEAPSSPQGRERASFLLAANPGEERRRLREAASGGELARLLLALQNAVREDDEPRALLFDEVDAGVGGRTASRVGERLRSLARSHQVLCITHLPQIAALGDTHFRIRKRVRSGRTLTQIEELASASRVEEIARMSARGRVTEATRRHARELLGES